MAIEDKYLFKFASTWQSFSSQTFGLCGLGALDLARRPVSEVMVSPVPTVSPDTELRRVAAVLLDTGLPGLPVTDEAGVLSGFISRTDILRAVAADPPLDLWSGPAVPL